MYHKIQLIGYLGRDPEMRYTPGGAPVTNFSVAANDNFTNAQGEKVERTLWFRVSAWGRMAEVANQYLRKGSPVMIEGRMVGDDTGNPRIWAGQDGEARASFEVNASRVIFLPHRDGGNVGGYESVDDRIGY